MKMVFYGRHKTQVDSKQEKYAVVNDSFPSYRADKVQKAFGSKAVEAMARCESMENSCVDPKKEGLIQTAGKANSLVADSKYRYGFWVR